MPHTKPSKNASWEATKLLRTKQTLKAQLNMTANREVFSHTILVKYCMAGSKTWYSTIVSTPQKPIPEMLQSIPPGA